MSTNIQQAAWQAIAVRAARRRQILAAIAGRITQAKTARQAVITAIATFLIEARQAGEAPRFRCRAYNGGPLRVARYDLPVVIDLQGLVTDQQGVYINLEHDDGQRVGHVTAVANTGRDLTLTGLISAATQAASEFIDSYRQDYPWHASVEVRPTQTPELIAPGATVTVNQQQFRGPLYVVRRSQLYGCAFLPRGADDQTEITVAARAAF